MYNDFLKMTSANESSADLYLVSWNSELSRISDLGRSCKKVKRIATVLELLLGTVSRHGNVLYSV